MDKLPTRKKLTHEQKDQLIEKLQSTIVKLELKIKQLEDRLAKNSGNSSKPPSSDWVNKPEPKSQRNRHRDKNRKQGGQKGHKGSTLRQADAPDLIEHHDPEYCEQCGGGLSKMSRGEYEGRQVFELPKLALDVTEHRAYQKTCGGCGATSKGEFPEGVGQPAQYGSGVKSLLVYLSQYQLIPYERLQELVGDLFNQPISVGTIAAAVKQAHKKLEGAEAHIKQALLKQELLHVDETGFRIKNERQWLHVASTNQLTFYGVHKKRGRAAMDEIGLLPKFEGTLVHDHWKAYFEYGKGHSLCNAHHLRELVFMQERHGQKWAEELEGLLYKIEQSVEKYATKGRGLPVRKQKRYRRSYLRILNKGKKECPLQKKPGNQRGRAKQLPARNLLNRLYDFEVEVLAFMKDSKVAFTNNQAERDVRMMKVQQKISGCFRTVEGAEAFCRIRGYISTAKKQNASVLDALQKAINNQPIFFQAA